MAKRSPRAIIKAKLVKLAGQIAITRDKNICQKCGKYVEGSNAQPSHVIPKSAGDVYKWNPENIKCLCFGCHLQWWHLNPTESGEWFRAKFPERWQYIKSLKPTIYKMWQLEEELEKLKEQYAKQTRL